MPVSNIAEITVTIINKIKSALVESGIWGLAIPDVFPDPMNDKEKNGISFYLYHIEANTHYKNSLPTGKDQPPKKFVSMALNLYYQLTALSPGRDEGDAAYDEQLLMTIALKALHDNPVVTTSGDENRCRISLQPVASNDAVHNWTAGSFPLKLSAYYEVTPVFLEPEESTIYTGRVLRYGNYVFAEGLPHISKSQSIIEFTIPGETTPREIISQPAQSAPGASIFFLGTGFTTGPVQLRLFNAAWNESVVAPNWDLTLSPNHLKVTVKETAVVEITGVPIAILPGMYSAQVVVTRTIELPDGTTGEFKHASNQSPFIVIPTTSINGITGGIVDVNGYGFIMNGPEEDKMELYLGANKITRYNSGVFEQSQFRVNSMTNLEINLPAIISSGQIIPVRVLVRGAESSPAWITIP